MAPQTYGLPIWARAKAIAFSALVPVDVPGVDEPEESDEPVPPEVPEDPEPLSCCCAASSRRLRSASSCAACCFASSAALRSASSCFFLSIAASRAFSSAVSSESSSRAVASFFWTVDLAVFRSVCESVSVSRLSVASRRFFIVSDCWVT